MNATSSTTSAAYVTWTFGTGRPPEEPPAGARVPAPKPFPPGPLRWEARRLDRELEPAR